MLGSPGRWGVRHLVTALEVSRRTSLGSTPPDWRSQILKIVGVFSLAVLVCGCGSTGAPLSQTGPSPTPNTSVGQVNEPDSGNWLAWVFQLWQPGLGEPLALGATVQSVVEHNDICVENLRSGWDARASCKRFELTASTRGRLDVNLRWDVAAPGYVPSCRRNTRLGSSTFGSAPAIVRRSGAE
jgi:hypothetical protein